MNYRKIESIISAYKILRRQNPDTWIIDCSNSKTIEQAIELAATAKNFANKKHPHQYRLPNSTLDSFAIAIIDKVDKVKKVKSFDDLILIIDSCRVKGIADLTIYDTAKRIGSYLGLYPVKIYLHSGTRKGAEILLGKVKGKFINANQLPQPFQTATLTAAEIEDILCIYKDRLLTCI